MGGGGTQLLVIRIVLLAALWLAFSGKFDAQHLLFGVFAVGLVAWATRTLRLVGTLTFRRQPVGQIRWGAALRYPFWLLGEVLKANISVARVILSPKLPIDPVIVRFDSGLESSLAQVLLANSITLTPGTFTVSIDHGVMEVHALTERGASMTSLSAMRQRVARVFGEDPAPDVALLDPSRGEDGQHP